MENITVLYVEDDKNISEEIDFFLSKNVKKVYIAYDGVEGIELFNKYKPDIIVTDIEMPRLNGFDMIDEILKLDKKTPIIVTSAFSETNKLLRGIELGVDAYLIKPINLKSLLQKIENLIKAKLLEKKLVEIDLLKAKEKELKEAQKKSQILLEEQNILLSLFDKGESVLFKCKNDENWTIEHASRNAERIIPGYYSLAQAKGIPFSSLIHKEDLQGVQKEMRDAVIQNKDSFSCEPFRLVTMDNKVKWIMSSIVTKKTQTGEIDSFIATVLDITQTRLKDQKIKNYLTLIDENIITDSTDLNGIITEASDAFCRLVGYTKDEVIGKTHKLFRDPSVSSKEYKELWDTIHENKVYRGEMKNIDKKGHSFWVKTKILPLFDDEGVKIGYFSVKQNITDKKAIEELSITDDLTKLYNRRYFNELFIKELNRVKRDQKSLAFVILDVDFFKAYNDTYGHQSGDEALFGVARVLKEFANRAGDSAFRLGGEEFALILVFDSDEKIEKHLKSLLNAIEALSIEHKENRVSKYVTVSMGYALTNSDYDLTANELYKRADSALYKAKENGRNQVVAYK